MGEYNDQLIDQNSSAAKQTIVDYGCEVYEPSADELKAFQQAVQSVYDKCISEGICTADELKEIAGYRCKGITACAYIVFMRHGGSLRAALSQ